MTQAEEALRGGDGGFIRDGAIKQSAALGEAPGEDLVTLVRSQTLRRSSWAPPSCTRRRSRATSASSSSADGGSTVTSLAGGVKTLAAVSMEM